MLSYQLASGQLEAVQGRRHPLNVRVAVFHQTARLQKGRGSRRFSLLPAWENTRASGPPFLWPVLSLECSVSEGCVFVHGPSPPWTWLHSRLWKPCLSGVITPREVSGIRLAPASGIPARINILFSNTLPFRNAVWNRRPRRRLGGRFRLIISKQDKLVVISGAYSNLLPTRFLRSLISDGSCRGFQMS